MDSTLQNGEAGGATFGPTGPDNFALDRWWSTPRSSSPTRPSSASSNLSDPATSTARRTSGRTCSARWLVVLRRGFLRGDVSAVRLHGFLDSGVEVRRVDLAGQFVAVDLAPDRRLDLSEREADTAL